MNDDDQIARRFAVFHAENPWVYIRLRELALDMRRAGIYHYGISGLFETLRYEVSIRTKSADGFKLNNNYRALYARELAKNEPELKGFFNFRMRRATGSQGLAPKVDAWDNVINDLFVGAA